MFYKDDDQDLLNDPNKGVEEARGILASLWRQLLVMHNVDGWRWDKLMRKYLADPRNGVQNNSRDRSSRRGNLNKELKRNDMTWLVFLKALNFIDAVRVVFTVQVTFANNKTYRVSAKLKDRGDYLENEEFNEKALDEKLDVVDKLSCSVDASLDAKREGFSPDDIIAALKGRR